MSYITVDIESDGPIPADYSMISFGAVLINPNGSLTKTFGAKLRPISTKWIPEALAVSGFTREQTMGFDDPKEVMADFSDWVKTCSINKPMFISDNNGFDWQFINYYFHHFLGQNPFGFSSTNLGSFYKGLSNNVFVNFKHLRKTKHTHDPIDDAMGNAEAFITMVNQAGTKINF